MSGPDFLATDVRCFEVAAFHGRFGALCSALHCPVLAPGEIGKAQAFLVLAHRPKRLMLLADGPSGPPPIPQTEAALIDLSSAKRQIRLVHPNARDLLMRGCRMDLRDKALPAHHVVSTQFGQVPVIIVCNHPGTSYRLLFERSLEATLIHGLQRAAITFL